MITFSNRVHTAELDLELTDCEKEEKRSVIVASRSLCALAYTDMSNLAVSAVGMGDGDETYLSNVIGLQQLKNF
jgi:hypothetical protein